MCFASSPLGSALLELSLCLLVFVSKIDANLLMWGCWSDGIEVCTKSQFMSIPEF